MINRQVAKGLLEDKGFICDEVDSGPNTISKFKESKPKYYEIILMDILMPEMDGFETTNAIRSLNRLDSKDVLIIALTANESLIDEEKALSKGMNAFLNKPFNVDEFISCVNSLVK